MAPSDPLAVPPTPERGDQKDEAADSAKDSQKTADRRSRYRKLPPQFPLPGWWARVLQQPRKLSLGAGFALRPRYPGSAALKLSPILFFDVEIKRKYFINVTDGIGLYFYRREKGRDFWSPYFELKLSLAPGFESRSAKEFPGLEPVGKTMLLKLSGTVGYGPLAIDVSTNTDALGQGHDGSFITLALQGKLRAFGETLISLGPEARFGGRADLPARQRVRAGGRQVAGRLSPCAALDAVFTAALRSADRSCPPLSRHAGHEPPDLRLRPGLPVLAAVRPFGPGAGLRLRPDARGGRQKGQKGKGCKGEGR